MFATSDGDFKEQLSQFILRATPSAAGPFWLLGLPFGGLALRFAFFICYNIQSNIFDIRCSLLVLGLCACFSLLTANNASF